MSLPAHGAPARAGSLLLLAVAACLLLSACGGDSTPVGTVKLFLKLSNNLNTEQKMYELLAPQTRLRMQQSARQASDQIGGHKGRLKPEDMFLLGLAAPPARVGEIKLLSKKGDRASVTISDRKGKHTEAWHLVKEEGGWRIILPRR